MLKHKALFQRVLSHPAKGLVNETNAALLTQKFWVQAIYTELLHASNRCSGEGTAETTQWAGTDASFESMVGLSSGVDSLFIWLPAAWMPLVVEAIRDKTLVHLGDSSAGRCCLY